MFEIFFFAFNIVREKKRKQGSKKMLDFVAHLHDEKKKKFCKISLFLNI